MEHNYNYIWQKLYESMWAICLGEGSPKDRAFYTLSYIGMLKAPITYIPEDAAPHIDKLQGMIDRFVAQGRDAVNDTEVEEYIKEILSAYTWVCHKRGPEHA